MMSCLHGRRIKMIVTLPSTTKELFEQLEESLSKLPQKDRNTFVLDLMKFCIDWQFAYLAFKDATKDA